MILFWPRGYFINLFGCTFNNVELAQCNVNDCKSSSFYKIFEYFIKTSNTKRILHDFDISVILFISLVAHSTMCFKIRLVRLNSTVFYLRFKYFLAQLSTATFFVKNLSACKTPTKF